MDIFREGPLKGHTYFCHLFQCDGVGCMLPANFCDCGYETRMNIEKGVVFVDSAGNIYEIKDTEELGNYDDPEDHGSFYELIVHYTLNEESKKCQDYEFEDIIRKNGLREK